MLETSNKKFALTVAVLLIVVVTAALWYRIFNRDSFNEVADTGVKSMPEVPTTAEPVVTFPVLTQEVPKLAGNVIVGTKVATKFYLARDGKRYVFPDETKTFDTWYPSGTSVKKLTQSELESYPLGGNVCYRPGTRLIRITTDTRVFAVAHNCVLRPINDGTATAIFGKNWKSLVDTLQDYYFTNYKIGEQISSSRDYSIETERGKSTTIDADKGL